MATRPTELDGGMESGLTLADPPNERGQSPLPPHPPPLSPPHDTPLYTNLVLFYQYGERAPSGSNTLTSVFCHSTHEVCK